MELNTKTRKADMREVEVPLSDDLLETLFALKGTKQFSSASYADIVRILLRYGVEAEEVSV